MQPCRGPSTAARRVLITGAAGFIGRNLTARLRGHGCSVVPLDDLSMPPAGPIPVDLWCTDLLRLTADDFSGLDAVVHLAARKSVPRSFADRDEIACNVRQDRHLLATAAAASVPLVLLASSCEVYGRQAGEGPLAESLPLNPMSPYAVSKVALELLAEVYRQLARDTRFVCVRLFNVYGPDEGADAVVPRFVQDILASGKLTIEGDGLQRRDLSYVDDVVRDLAALLYVQAPPRVLNLGSGSSEAIGELAALIIRTVGFGAIRHARPRVNEIAEFRADTTLLEALLGGRGGRTDLVEGIGRCVEAGRVRLARVG